MKQVSKAIGGAVGSGSGMAIGAFLLPEGTPWWGYALVIVVTTFITVYFSPRNAQP